MTAESVAADGGPRLRVVFSERLGALGDQELSLADGRDVELVVRPVWTEDALVDACADADVLVVGAPEPVTARVLRALPRLRAVVRRGIGVDNVDVAAATALGIQVAYVPAASVEEVSDHALALAVSLSRRLQVVEAAVRAGDLAAAGAAAGSTRRLGESTLGVVGFGRIGRALARKASSVFGRVIAHDPMLSSGDIEGLGVELVPLDSIWADSDVISLHAPGSPQGPLVDAAALAAMRRGVVLVNTARGTFVDEHALRQALRDGQVSGAGLDVTAAEPIPAGSPLLDAPGLVLTGHTAAKGLASSPALRQGVVASVAAVLDGRAAEHLADPQVLASPLLRGVGPALSTEGS